MSLPQSTPPPSGDPDPLVATMAAMVGDRAGVFAFYERFGDQLRRTVRAVLVSWGRHDLARDGDEVEGLAMDAALVIGARAGGWDPTGAPPWVWARRAIEADMVRTVGHARAPGDLEAVEVVLARSRPVGAMGTVVDDPPSAHRDDPRLELLEQAISEALPDDRARRVYVEYRLQKLLGDPSPARTLTAMFALNADNLRQIASRSHRRVARLVGGDERYRDLRNLGWFSS